MTDALCGPANPLQNLQKHAQADRTLQQDRLATRKQPPGYAFRTPDPNPTLLDAEFEAFQASQPPLPAPGSLLHSEQRNGYSPQPAQPMRSSAGWADDFAKLNIAPEPPVGSPFQHAQPDLSLQQQYFNSSPWHAEFARSQQPQTSQLNQQPQQYQPRFSGLSHATPFNNVQQPFGYVAPTTQYPSALSEERWKGKGRWQSEETQLDHAAWEAEFEALAKEQLQRADAAGNVAAVGEEQAVGVRSNIQPESMRSHLNQDASQSVRRTTEEQQTLSDAQQQELAEDQLHDLENRLNANGLLPPTDHDMETMRPIPTGEAEQMHDQEKPQTPAQPDVDAELAQTAGVLLDTVSDNQSEKFQQSSFLALMRQFRDHEVRVEGDKVVDANRPEEVREYSVYLPQFIQSYCAS